MTFNSNGLREKALTVRLSRTMFQAEKSDTRVAQATELQWKAEKAGRYTKRLLRDCEEFCNARAAFTDIHRYVMKYTLPWMDDGIRLLPSEKYLDFANGLSELKEIALRKVQELADVWDDAVLKDKERLGDMWNPDDYPTKEDMVTMWDVKVAFLPIPAVDDFRVDLSDSDKNAFESAIKEAEENANTDLLARILAPVAHMVEKLSDPKARFHDTLLGNVKDVCTIAKDLNLNNDARITEIVASIEDKLQGVKTDELRQDSLVRFATAEDMKEVQSKLQEWI